LEGLEEEVITFQRSVMAFSGRQENHEKPIIITLSKIQTRQVPKRKFDTTLLDPTCSVYYRISNVCIIPKTTLFLIRICILKVKKKEKYCYSCDWLNERHFEGVL
jgi:hypothetical protein